MSNPQTRDLEEVVTRFCKRHLGFDIMMGELLNQGGCSKVYRMQSSDRSIKIVKVGILNNPELLLAEGQLQYEVSEKTTSVPKVFYLGTICVTEGNEVMYTQYDSSANGKKIIVPAGTKIPITVMESIHGDDLYTWLSSKQRTLYERVERFQQIVDAVGNIHDAGVVHKDIKPANILVRNSGKPVIIDFGIAERIGKNPVPGLRCTPNYASPEHIQEKTDPRMDIYSLGCVLYEMLTGKTPLDDTVDRIFKSTPEGGSNVPLQLLEAMMEETTQAIEVTKTDEQRYEHVPLEMNEIHYQCRRFNPAERYQSCRELSVAIEQVLDNMSVCHSVLNVLSREKPQKSRGKRLDLDLSDL